MKLQKLLVLAIVSMFVLSIGAAIPVHAQEADMYTSPAAITWDTSGHSVGDTFVVTVHVDNIADWAGFQYDLTWNSAVLSAVAADVVKTQPFPGTPFEAAYSVNPGIINWVLASMAGPVTGSFTIMTITFHVIAAPPAVIGGSVSSPIALSNEILGNSAGDPIVHTLETSMFTFNFVAPPAPVITAGSKTLGAPGTFDLPITISSYSDVYALTAVHMVMTYDPAIVTATGATAAAWGGIVTVDTSIAGQITIDVASVVPVGSSGIIVNVQMNGFFDPGEGMTASCVLGLTATFNAGEAFSAVNNGFYQIAIPSAAMKAISIEPPVTSVSDEGVIFTVEVVVHNITSVDKLFGVQYTFHYDQTKIQLLSVMEGPFFAAFPWQPTPPATWFFVYDHPDLGYFTVAQGLLGGGAEPLGYIYPFTVEPAGGIVAYATFKSIYGIPGSTVSAPLTLTDVVFGNVDAMEIPVGLIHDAMYELTLDSRYIDIFTQYPDPYGGQRRFFDSDAFTEQDLVCIYAYVTYNGWPVGNKLVNFEIHGPENPYYNIVLYYVAMTNSSGYAEICFRIDWPVENAEDIVFGTWTVEGSVSLDGVLVIDVLHFQVGWLIEITKVTTNEIAYRHGWHMTITVDYTSISHQLRNAFFTVTMTDDANYGMGSLTFETIVAYGDGHITVTCFMIPYWARSGTGTVHADVFTANPSAPDYGRAYCPEYDQTFTILAE